jgi:hypothetical protein
MGGAAVRQHADPPAQLADAAADWSRYVTTGQFLASHLVASLLGAAIGALGMVALGAVLARRGRPDAGLGAMVTGVLANVITAAVFGVAAFAQPAIGRDYLAGHTAQARLLVTTVVNGGWLNATAIPAELLLAASVVVAGVGVARTGSLPAAAGAGFAGSMVLFVIGGIPDNGPWQSIAAALMIASTVWIAVAAGRRRAPVRAVGASDAAHAESHAGVAHSSPAGAARQQPTQAPCSPCLLPAHGLYRGLRPVRAVPQRTRLTASAPPPLTALIAALAASDIA